MFELYKKRELGDNIVDTFTFFKIFGKHFFKIFFIINGVFLLVMGILVYWFLKINFQVVFDNNLGEAKPNYLLNYFNDSYGFLAGFIVLFVLIILVLALFNSSYPIVYLKLIEKNKTNDFTLNDVITGFRQNLWKILKFCIGLIFIIVPVLFISIVLMFLLCFVLIGFPLLLIAIPTFFTWVNFCFYSYLTEEMSFFQSINHAYHLVKENFWTTIGTTFLVMIIVQMIQGSITMFLYFIGIFVFFISALGNPNFDVKPFDGSPILLIFISLLFILIFALSNIFSNMMTVNQGIIYYSLGAEDKMSTSEIELIGTDNE